MLLALLVLSACSDATASEETHPETHQEAVAGEDGPVFHVEGGYCDGVQQVVIDLLDPWAVPTVLECTDEIGVPGGRCVPSHAWHVQDGVLYGLCENEAMLRLEARWVTPG